MLDSINFFGEGLDFLIVTEKPQCFGSFSITEAYDKMQVELITAKESLTKILTSKDVKATVCSALIYPLTKPLNLSTLWSYIARLTSLCLNNAVIGDG